MTVPFDTCSSCRAPIVWGITDTGKRMPFDAVSTPKGRWRLDGGRAVYVKRSARELVADQLRMPHWATCPFADLHRSAR